MESIRLYVVDGIESGKYILVTEEQKNELVDTDLAWHDGEDWCVLNCQELTEYMSDNDLKFKQ